MQPTGPPLLQDETSEGIFRVNINAFMDQELFREELATIFAKAWLYVGHSSEIPSVGDFLSRSVGGRPVIFVRGKDGSARVLFNSCAHQGSEVCRVASGHASAFQCFFHGWTYNLEGQLVGLPGKASYEGTFDMSQHGLATPRVEEYRGFVFMCCESTGLSLQEYLGEARTYLDLVADQDEDLAVVPGSHRYVTFANWKLLTMNSSDGYHVATTHATYLKYLRDIGADRARHPGKRYVLGSGHSAAEFDGGWARPIARWAPYWPGQTRSYLTQKRTELVNQHGAERGRLMADLDRNLLIYPNLAVNDHAAILIRTWEPVSVDSIRVTAWTLAPRNEPPEIKKLRLQGYLTFFGPAGFATPDDIEALEAAQDGFKNGKSNWYDVSKGCIAESTHRARSSNDDEDQGRGFWRRWAQDMGVLNETRHI